MISKNKYDGTRWSRTGRMRFDRRPNVASVGSWGRDEVDKRKKWMEKNVQHYE
jgi:hypothetical protein